MHLNQLVLASSNLGKRREFERLLAPLGVQVLSQDDLGIAAAPEPFETFLENALTKARHASQQSGLPALADDSGLCVPILQGAPGVQSARYASPVAGHQQDALNNSKLVAQLREHQDRRAFYVAVLVLVRHAQDPLPVVAQAHWQGDIVLEPRGENGFGYDPHFWIATHNKTVGELDAAIKNDISHRAVATRRLLTLMSKLGLAGDPVETQNKSQDGCAVVL